MMEKPWKITFGKGQWMITTRGRIWIVSPGVILLKAALVICAIFALAYSIRSGFKAWQSDAATARISAIINNYQNKNSREAERRRQILLFAYNLFTKRSEVSPNYERRILREPYATVFHMEQQLGKADERNMDGEEQHLAWDQTIWQMPPEWSARSDHSTTWPSSKSKILEAWFDKRGYIVKMVVVRREPDDRIETESIGRRPSDWDLQKFDP